METSRKWISFSLPSGEVNATGSFWGMASPCLPMPNLILSNLIEFYGPHSNLRTLSKFPFLSCIQIEHMWEARNISTLTKSNVQMHRIYCYFSSAPPASIPACYSRPIDFENSVSIQLTSRDFQRTGHESKSWLVFLQGMLGMKVLKGLNQRLNIPRWWRERSQECLALLTSLRYLSPTSQQMSEPKWTSGWVFV